MNLDQEIAIIEKAKEHREAFGPLYQKYHEAVFSLCI
jgi:hypothetical protein